MGDRRSIVVSAGDKAEAHVVLYSHWSGGELPQILARALDRSTSRWDDAPYLTRVIFCQMLADHNPEDLIEGVMGTTGFGIEAILPGSDEYTEANQEIDLFVDVERQTVYDGDETVYSFEGFARAYRP